jgi:murein L,D-transpeptidase YafK
VFVCTTGQKEGDKEVEGDLKTPEGVYFVVRRIDAGLDFTKYGPRAFTLNYPNPVDRMRGKTGFGIWIHGRGEPLVPLQTEGCVAMHNSDLSVLGKALLPGAPVTLTRSFAFTADGTDDDGDLRKLERNVRDWAEAWSGRSRRFFEFYNQAAYSAAQGESFSVFRAQKERLFAQLPWIRTTVKDIKILPGPDYWVTWFRQEYQAPNLSTGGTRRLYWEKSGTEFRIVGMEWEPGLDDVSLTTSVASLLPPSDQGDPLALLDAVWRSPADATYVASAAGTSGRSAHDAGASAFVPASAPAGAPAAPSAGAEYAVSSPAVQRGRSTPDHIENPAFGPMPRPSEAAFRLAARRAAENARRGSDGNALPPRPAHFRSPDEPAQSGGSSASAGTEQGPDRAAADAATSVPGSAAAAVADIPVASSSAAAASKTQADPLPDAAGAIMERIEAWRAAWERGDLAAYTRFYASKAIQGERRGAADIRRRKAELWRRSRPATVRLSDVRVQLQNGRLVADMRQDYAGRAGGGDAGIKTLTFEKIHGVWLITREEWRGIEAGH